MSTAVFIKIAQSAAKVKPVGIDLKLQAQSELISFYSNQTLYQYKDKYYLVCGSLRHKSETSASALAQYLRGEDNPIPFGQYLGIEYSPKENRIIIINDSLACFPLYILKTAEAFYLSTQPGFFRALDNYKPALNSEKIPAILAATFSAADKCIIKDVSPLPKGSRLDIDLTGLRISKKEAIYPCTENNISFKEASAQLKQILSEVTSEYLQSFNNPASELSGGIDSSCITAQLSELTSAKCKAFSISFPHTELDEGLYRQDFKQKHSLSLTEFPGKILPLEYYQENCNKLFLSPDFPNSILANLYLGSKEAAGTDLLLSGFGGDHLFSGKCYQQNFTEKYFPHLTVFRKFQAVRSFPILKKNLALREYEQLLARKNEIAVVSASSVKQMIYYLLKDPANQEYLSIAQLSANSYGISRLHPLFDKRVIDFTLSLPDNLLQAPKKLLKEALQAELPDSIMNREDKTDFSQLFYKTLEQASFRPILEQAIERFESFLNPDYCRKVTANMMFDKNYNVFSFWNLAALEILAGSGLSWQQTKHF